MHSTWNIATLLLRLGIYHIHMATNDEVWTRNPVNLWCIADSEYGYLSELKYLICEVKPETIVELLISSSICGCFQMYAADVFKYVHFFIKKIANTA